MLGLAQGSAKRDLNKNSKARRTWSKIVGGYERPFPSLRFLLCLAQRSLPLFAGVVLSALLCKDGVGNFEDAMGRAMETGCIAGTVKAPLRWGFLRFIALLQAAPRCAGPLKSGSAGSGRVVRYERSALGQLKLNATIAPIGVFGGARVDRLKFAETSSDEAGRLDALVNQIPHHRDSARR